MLSPHLKALVSDYNAMRNSNYCLPEKNLEQLKALVSEFCDTVSDFPGTDGEFQLLEECCIGEASHFVFSIRLFYDPKGGETDE